jgi:hypothetical protein
VKLRFLGTRGEIERRSAASWAGKSSIASRRVWPATPQKRIGFGTILSPAQVRPVRRFSHGPQRLRRLLVPVAAVRSAKKQVLSFERAAEDRVWAALLLDDEA